MASWAAKTMSVRTSPVTPKGMWAPARLPGVAAGAGVGGTLGSRRRRQPCPPLVGQVVSGGCSLHSQPVPLSELRRRVAGAFGRWGIPAEDAAHYETK